MGKIYQSIDSLDRSTIASNSCDRANTNDLDRHRTSLDSKLVLNNKTVLPFIQVQIPYYSSVLTKLWIYIPEYFKPQTATIQITERHYIRMISALISYQGRWLQIKFKYPIFPDTKLQINFNLINMNMYYKLPEYFVYGKSVDGQSSFVGRGYFKRKN